MTIALAVLTVAALLLLRLVAAAAAVRELLRHRIPHADRLALSGAITANPNPKRF